MKILDHFDFDRCREHLQHNGNSSLLLTMRDGSEFSVTDLDDVQPGSKFVSGTRFPDHQVSFDPAAVVYAMLLPIDPRQDWKQGVTEVSVSTRDRRKKPNIPGDSHERLRPAA